MLTRKQQELLLFINQRLAQGGVSPSFEEMKEALDLKSKSGIHRLISGLEERGFIRRPPPPSYRNKFSPTVIRGDFKNSGSSAAPANGNETVELEMLGRIAAGTPIE